MLSPCNTKGSLPHVVKTCISFLLCIQPIQNPDNSKQESISVYGLWVLVNGLFAKTSLAFSFTGCERDSNPSGSGLWNSETMSFRIPQCPRKPTGNDVMWTGPPRFQLNTLEWNLNPLMTWDIGIRIFHTQLERHTSVLKNQPWSHHFW